jgi:L-aspartate oxidase
MKENHFDIIIVGSGVGGLTTLRYITESDSFKKGNLKIGLLSKSALNITNTDWAQGGIAAVKSTQDNFDKHIDDTIIAGAFENDPYIVKKVIESGPSIMNDLIRWDIQLDKNENEFDLVKEGGHSEARIWHWKDQTGHALQTCLANDVNNHSNIQIVEDVCVLQCQKDNADVFHLQTISSENNNLSVFTSPILILATGGIGCLYEKTTNQSVSTCDGIAIAAQLGASIQDLSYVQFHPTGLYHEGQISFLISEALRGAGAELKNVNMESFMSKYDVRGSLAPRDIVSRSILKEMDLTNEAYVFLDTTLIPEEYFQNHFPNIIAHCKNVLHIDPIQAPIPVVPVQHYSCGGIKVDEHGETSISGLFAVGEVACTGLHGANRLASNSLLEAMAFGKFIAQKTCHSNRSSNQVSHQIIFDVLKLKNIQRSDVQHIMSKYAGVVRSNDGMKKGLEELQRIACDSTYCESLDKTVIENNNLLQTGILLLENAIQKTCNKGTHFNIDLA